MPEIAALRRLRQEDSKFEDLDYIVRSCLETKQTNKQPPPPPHSTLPGFRDV
jgi:hypothetical protein